MEKVTYWNSFLKKKKKIASKNLFLKPKFLRTTAELPYFFLKFIKINIKIKIQCIWAKNYLTTSFTKRLSVSLL